MASLLLALALCASCLSACDTITFGDSAHMLWHHPSADPVKAAAEPASSPAPEEALEPSAEEPSAETEKPAAERGGRHGKPENVPGP